MISKHRGAFPCDLKELLKLPGVGKYIAGAICSIAFNQPEPVVDGNIRRVITRLAGIRRRIPEKFFWNQMRSWIPRNRSSEFNQSVMELGALICTAVKPSCPRCPVRSQCIAHREGIESSLPKARKRKPVQKIRIVTLLLQRGDRFLLTLKNDSHAIPGKWGLPYAKIRDQKDPADVAKSLCRRILGKEVPLEECVLFRHSISGRLFFVYGYFGRATGKLPDLAGKYRWENSQTAPLTSSLFRKVIRGLP